MGLDWTPDQVKIYNLFAEGKVHKEVVAAGFDKGIVSKVKREIQAGGSPPDRKLVAVAPPKPKITGEEGEEILTQITGFQTEDEALLFIFDPRTKRVRQFRHKYPRAVPMYLDCLKPPINFKGSFDEWLFTMAHSYLKAAGWEYAMVPRSQGQIYEEFKRLLKEGSIKLDFDEDNNPKLEVIHGNGEGRDRGEGEGDHPAEAGARPPDDEIPHGSTTRKKKQPVKSK